MTAAHRWTPAARPTWLRAANATGRALAKLGIGRVRLDAQSLKQAARRATGLDDFGSDAFFDEGIEILGKSLEQEAAFTPVGARLARNEMVTHLSSRLRVLDVLKRHPEVHDEEIREPLFVTGTGRSGTSILHEVLAQDAGNRPLLHWEGLFPCPPPETATHASDPRAKAGDWEVWRWEKIAPAYKAMHEGGGAVPQEDDLLFNYTLLSDHIPGLYQVPSFARWLSKQDREPAWQMHKAALKLLQWKMPKRRWVLKAPTHLTHLERLFQTYPDARVLMTHRDPLKVVASMASLRTTLYWMRSDEVDPLALAENSSFAIRYMLDQFSQVRESGRVPAERVGDVHFHEFMSEPVEAIRKAYGAVGLELTAQAAEGMRAYLAAKPRDRGHGRHRYSLEDLGLDPREVSDSFRAYRERYQVPAEEE